MMKKFYFNMIEIILAIAIIAIGISSVMVLFTSGLRSSNGAVTANTLPDATESLLSAVRHAALSYGQANGWGSNFNTLFTGIQDNDWAKENGLKLSDFGSKLDENGSRLIVLDGGKSVLYRQLSVVPDTSPVVYTTDFSAVAEVRQITPAALVISHPVTPDQKLADSSDAVFNDADGSNALGNCRKVLSVRISYPAHLPMSERESKIYRLELFNDKYDRFLP